MPAAFLHLLSPISGCPEGLLDRAKFWNGFEDLENSGVHGDGIVIAVEAPDLPNLREARDDGGLPKWGVVDAAELAGLTAEAAWRVVEREAERHRLARENARLRGDLLTLGRKFAHDLRSPLGGVLSTAELLKEMLEEVSPGDAALTRPVFDSVKTVTRLVDRMSLVTRVTARGAARRETARMDGPLLMALQRLDRQVSERGATVERGDTGTARGDAALLEEIWFLLLENALAHGGLRIRAGFADGWWFVEDDGPGVSAEHAGALFQPFHTLHDPGSARGLGLSLVERLVALQGGECAHSVPANGAGARFSFRLGAAADV